VADDLTPAQRSYAMSRVRSKGNLSTEQRMVVLLKAAGMTGWRRHLDLPGKPDFAFRRERVAVFVDGCFWHRCPRCFRMPTTNPEYWTRKIARNVARDRRVARELTAKGWTVVRIWEHSLERQPGRVIGRLRRALVSPSLPVLPGEANAVVQVGEAADGGPISDIGDPSVVKG
jgi:DNA mismatch endonuclease (patch repair protein)